MRDPERQVGVPQPGGGGGGQAGFPSGTDEPEQRQEMEEEVTCRTFGLVTGRAGSCPSRCLHKSVRVTGGGLRKEEINTVRGSGFASGKGGQNSVNFWEEDRKLKGLP